MKTSAALRKRSARPYEQIVIEGVKPAVEHGRFPVKAIVGELCPIEATVFRHGHERVRVMLRVRRPSNGGIREIPMQLVDPSQDLWRAEFLLDAPGRFTFTIAAWTDLFATWAQALKARLKQPGVDLSPEISNGQSILERALGSAKGETKKELTAISQRLSDAGSDAAGVLAVISDPAVLDTAGRAGPRDDEVRYDTDFELMVERPLARTAAWVELPADPGLAGSRLPELHDLGFDMICLQAADLVPEGFERLVHDAGVHGIEVGVDLVANFEPDDSGWKDRWAEVREIVRAWIAFGVKVFRVKDPGLQPIGFWSWLIQEIHRDAPEVIFLAGAVPRQPMMRALGRRGFTLSVACFRPHGTKADLVAYMSGLIAGDTASSIRPSFVVKEADMEEGGEAAFKARLVLAATLSPSYGLRGGPRLEGSDGMAGFVRALNRARKANAALQHLTNLRFLDVEDENLVAYVKSTPDHSNSVIVVVNLDPFSAHASVIHVPEEGIGLGRGERYRVEDVLSGAISTWSGSNHVHLDPLAGEPALVLAVRGR